MEIYSNIDSLSKAPKNASITIGVFDGCHLGHIALLQKTLDIANDTNSPSGVITFSSHPDLILQPDKPLQLLMSVEQRLRYFDKMGFDFAIIIAFDNQLRHTSAERFIHKYLVGALNISNLALGYDSCFGDKRRGNLALAKKELTPLNINVTSVDSIDIDGPISSTRIRKFLSCANMQGARDLIGRPYSIFGRVGHGDQRGRTIGFPTANVIVDFDVPIPFGVWAAKAILESGDEFSAAVHWGKRPTFKNSTTPKSHMEVHIIGFNDNLYGLHLEIIFIKQIRKEISFNNPTELSLQIKKDIDDVKKITDNK